MLALFSKSNWSRCIFTAAFVWLLGFTSAASADDVNVLMSTEDFLKQAFDDQYQSDMVWITPGLRDQLEAAMNAKSRGARIRYWRDDHRSAWILERIGKERPITAGFVVEDNQIISTHVLTYRESKGGEIRYPTFNVQFKGATLDKSNQLDRHIDGITGATLSVDAMKRMATASLIMARESLGPQKVSSRQ